MTSGFSTSGCGFSPARNSYERSNPACFRSGSTNWSSFGRNDSTVYFMHVYFLVVLFTGAFPAGAAGLGLGIKRLIISC